MSLNYLKGKIGTADELLCKKPVEFIVNSRFKVSERRSLNSPLFIAKGRFQSPFACSYFCLEISWCQHVCVTPLVKI